jgi:hypothetical protein
MKVPLLEGNLWKQSTLKIDLIVEKVMSVTGAWSPNLRADKKCFIQPSKSTDFTRIGLKILPFIRH